MNNYDINMPKPINKPDIYTFEEGKYIEVQLYEKRGTRFYEIMFYNNGFEKYIGKFYEDIDQRRVKTLYKDNKILVYRESFKEETSQMEISSIDCLYNLEDDCIFACTEEEALNIFDVSKTTKFLDTKNIKKLVINKLNRRYY